VRIQAAAAVAQFFVVLIAQELRSLVRRPASVLVS
jgi:hypothetical protein